MALKRQVMKAKYYKRPGDPRHFTSARTGPFCGAKRFGREETCRNGAGFRTEHPGQGRCFKHGGNRVTKSGRYAGIEHATVQERMDEIAAMETNVLDLEPEALLLRALIADYIDRYEDFVNALMAWYHAPDVKVKPRRILDISDASNLIESVSRIVERIHKIQSSGAISLATFARVTEQMGIIVANHVKDETVLNTIDTEWASLALDAKNPRTTPTLEEEEDNE